MSEPTTIRAYPLLAYHFLKADWTSGQGNESAWTVGETRWIEGKPVLCERGYHASADPVDALRLSPGTVACRVELLGEVLYGQDKMAAQGRRLIAGRDCRVEIGLWACDCAESALLRERDAGREPDPRSWAGIETKRRWLRGEATDEEHRYATAYAYATAAAYATADAAATDAATDAYNVATDAYNAAYDDATDAGTATAAFDAATADAAGTAAATDAYAAERQWQTERLTQALGLEEIT